MQLKLDLVVFRLTLKYFICVRLLLPFELHEKGYDEKGIAQYMAKRRKHSSGSDSRDDDSFEIKSSKPTPTAKPEKLNKPIAKSVKSPRISHKVCWLDYYFLKHDIILYIIIPG